MYSHGSSYTQSFVTLMFLRPTGPRLAMSSMLDPTSSVTSRPHGVPVLVQQNSEQRQDRGHIRKHPFANYPTAASLLVSPSLGSDDSGCLNIPGVKFAHAHMLSQQPCV